MSGVAPDHDRRLRCLAGADVALPAGKPIEVLEDRAVGMRLEGAPILFDFGQILIDRERYRARMSGRR